MRKLIILFFSLFFSLNIFSSSFGINNGFGIGIGYSYIHDYRLHDRISPCHMVQFDAVLCGIYFGYGYGTNMLYNEFGYYESYRESIDVNMFKFGVSTKISLSDNVSLNLTPYVGFMYFSYNETYFDSYFCNHYYDKYHHYFIDVYDSKFIYGGKASININMVDIGVNYSNKECGVTIGILF